MPSAAPRREARGEGRRAALSFLLVAAAVVAARLPFLILGSRFFDSDEAVEGLMARHVLGGEFPLYLWGQRYKGVPEVYLAAAAFRVWPAGIVALKAVTLACFAAYACLNLELLTRLFSRRIAWIATAFLIAGPPSLVLWTLSGSAEMVMTCLSGTLLLLGLTAWHRTGSRAGLAVAAASLGCGLWIQQYILYYVAAIAITVTISSPPARRELRELAVGAGLGRWARDGLGLLGGAAGIYIVLGLAAFFGPGFAISPLGIPITVSDPQKMWWIAAGLLLIAAAGVAAARITRDHAWYWWLAPALGFLAGYSPAIAGRFLSEGPGSPMARMDLTGLTAALPQFGALALPMLFGFRSPTTERLAVPAWTALLVAGVVVFSYFRMARLIRERGDSVSGVFHVFAVIAPILFFVSGSYIDAQSYRYLMPIHAALPAVYALGIDGVFRANRIAGIVLLSALVSLFAFQQMDWYRRLEPDREAATIVECLNRSDIRTARADYWLAYKLTFLTGERTIVVPTNGVDRYPPYTALVKADAPAVETICR